MKKPPINHGSQAHSMLCYARMRRTTFTPDEARKCISGVFKGSRSLNDARRACQRLQKNGFLNTLGNDTWVITEYGIEALFVIANYHRQHKERLLGRRYMAMVNKQIGEVRALSTSMGDLDIEDEILDQIALKTKSAQKRKSKKKSK